MAGAKEKKIAADKARKETRDRAIDLVTGRRRPKKDNKMMTFAIVAAVIVVVVGGLILVTRKKPAPAPLASKTSRTTKSSAENQGASRRAQKKSDRSARSAKSDKPASPMTGSLSAAPAPRRVRVAAVPHVRAQKPQRPQRNQAQTQPAPRTKKDRSSGRTRQSAPGSWEVTGISEGTVLIGNRAAREGDVIRGRIVREVGADFVHVEYSGATYTLRVGDAMP
jgi:cytoskeletal protein RodZ